MGKSYSSDMRIRVAKAVAGRSSRRAAAERFGVSISSAIRWTSRSERTGTTTPDVHGRPPGSGKLSAYLYPLRIPISPRPHVMTRVKARPGGWHAGSPVSPPRKAG